MENVSENKNMTDEERIALAAKLDADLDNFIDSLEKKRYSEGWPADRWEQVRTFNVLNHMEFHYSMINFRKWRNIRSL